MFRWLISVLTVIALSGCANFEPNQATSEVRIVAAAAGAAEILQDLSLGSAIVGVDERNRLGARWPVITNGHALNLELVTSLNPTHLVVDELIGPKESLARLQDKGVKVIRLKVAESIADIFLKYRELGKAFAITEAAEEAAGKLRLEFEKFARGKTSFKIAFLYLRGTNSIYLIGGKGSGADSLIEAVGSIDVGANLLDRPFVPLSAEVMAQLNPEVIILMESGLKSVGGLTGLRNLPGLAATSAVRTGQIISVPDSDLLNFGPSTLRVLEKLQEELVKFNAS